MYPTHTSGADTLPPLLPLPLKNIVAHAKQIVQMGGTLNSVLLIDDRYVLRTRKIKLYDFDDIGSCANFHAAVNYICSRGFRLCPGFLRYEENGERTGFLLYEKEAGVPLAQTAKNMTPEELERTAVQAAQVLHELHRIPAPQYGFFSGSSFPSWEAFLMYWIRHQTPYIRKKGLLTEAETEAVASLFEANRNLITIPRPATLHLDYCDRNIIMDTQGKIVNIIDWDNSRGGDPLADVAYTLDRAFKNDMYADFRKRFKETYRDLLPPEQRAAFEKKLQLYSLFYAYKLIPVHSAHTSDLNENAKQLRDEVRRLLSIIA